MGGDFPAIGSTHRRKRDGQIILVVGHSAAWIEYRAGVAGQGRKNSVMAENFEAKYEPWPEQHGTATGSNQSGGTAIRDTVEHNGRQ